MFLSISWFYTKQPSCTSVKLPICWWIVSLDFLSCTSKFVKSYFIHLMNRKIIRFQTNLLAYSPHISHKIIWNCISHTALAYICLCFYFLYTENLYVIKLSCYIVFCNFTSNDKFTCIKYQLDTWRPLDKTPIIAVTWQFHGT